MFFLNSKYFLLNLLVDALNPEKDLLVLLEAEVLFIDLVSEVASLLSQIQDVLSKAIEPFLTVDFDLHQFP